MTEPKLTLDETTARVEKNSNENRVTIPSIKAKIVDARYTTVDETTLTICVITMQNGFTFVGHSACADPANFDVEVGQRYAYENAFKQIWSHEAYLIRERLHRDDEFAKDIDAMEEANAADYNDGDPVYRKGDKL